MNRSRSRSRSIIDLRLNRKTIRRKNRTMSKLVLMKRRKECQAHKILLHNSQVRSQLVKHHLKRARKIVGGEELLRWVTILLKFSLPKRLKSSDSVFQELKLLEEEVTCTSVTMCSTI
jgi:hypothetical protein